jgi:hypothetical protein
VQTQCHAPARSRNQTSGCARNPPPLLLLLPQLLLLPLLIMPPLLLLLLLLFMPPLLQGWPCASSAKTSATSPTLGCRSSKNAA